jgi:hypothetical protein
MYNKDIQDKIISTLHTYGGCSSPHHLMINAVNPDQGNNKNIFIYNLDYLIQTHKIRCIDPIHGVSECQYIILNDHQRQTQE